MRVGLFITCLTDTLYPEAGKATVAVLERLGHKVVVPAGQTCCGQMHANSGYAEEALPLVRNFVRTFGAARPRRGRRAVGIVRGDGPPPLRAARRRGR